MSNITLNDLAATLADQMLKNGEVLTYSSSVGCKHIVVKRELVEGEYWVILRGSLLMPGYKAPRAFRIVKRTYEEIQKGATSFFLSGLLGYLSCQSEEDWKRSGNYDEMIDRIFKTFNEANLSWDIYPDQRDSWMGNV